MLIVPEGAELFRCQCGQTLRAPNTKNNQANSNNKKSNNNNKDLMDAGLGIG